MSRRRAVLSSIALGWALLVLGLASVPLGQSTPGETVHVSAGAGVVSNVEGIIPPEPGRWSDTRDDSRWSSLALVLALLVTALLVFAAQHAHAIETGSR